MVGFAGGSLTIAICDRCRMTLPYQSLRRDPDTPGLRVCRECADRLDPYKLPPRQLEAIVVRFPRPDVPLSTGTTEYQTVFSPAAFSSSAFVTVVNLYDLPAS